MRSTADRPTARSLGELPPDALVRAEELGRFLGCSARTVVRAGIPSIEIRPRVRRYFVKDVLEWLEHQRNGTELKVHTRRSRA